MKKQKRKGRQNHLPKNGQVKKENMWSFDLKPSRIEALCDGLLAIAMTILVLELSMDEHILEAIALVGDGDFTHLFIGLYAYVLGYLEYIGHYITTYFILLSVQMEY